MDEEERNTLMHQAAGAGVDRDAHRALSLVDQVLRARPDDVDALLLRGHVLEMTGQTGLARQAYERVLELDPGNTHAIIDLADCDAYDDDFESALERLEQAQSRVQAGLYHSDRATELDEILQNRYTYLMRLGRVDDAMKVLEEGLQLLPDSNLWALLLEEHKRRS